MFGMERGMELDMFKAAATALPPALKGFTQRPGYLVTWNFEDFAKQLPCEDWRGYFSKFDQYDGRPMGNFAPPGIRLSTEVVDIYERRDFTPVRDMTGEVMFGD